MKFVDGCSLKKIQNIKNVYKIFYFIVSTCNKICTNLSKNLQFKLNFFVCFVISKCNGNLPKKLHYAQKLFKIIGIEKNFSKL